MNLPGASILLTIVASILVSGVLGDDSASTTSEELSSESISTELGQSTSIYGSTSTSDESLTDDDSSSPPSTTVAPGSDESGQNLGHHEQPKLPVDLLSEDILLDPNVVLARVARDAPPPRDLSRYNEFYHPRQRPSRRSDSIENEQRNSGFGKLRIYPVFPG